MKRTILVLTVLALAGGFAYAKERKGPCKEYVKQFCADVKPGKGKIKDCLIANESKFQGPMADKCKKNIEKRIEKHKENVKNAK